MIADVAGDLFLCAVCRDVNLIALVCFCYLLCLFIVVTFSLLFFTSATSFWVALGMGSSCRRGAKKTGGARRLDTIDGAAGVASARVNGCNMFEIRRATLWSVRALRIRRLGIYACV